MSLSTLKFAQRASSVELGAARSNKESNKVIELKVQVESLKKALANRGALASQAMKPKEARTPPLQKPRVGNERTTPQTRRLSIENCVVAKGEKTTPLVNTRPRSRRLSLEGPRVIAAPRSSLGSAVKHQVTPPRPRSLPVSVSASNIQLAPKSPLDSAVKSHVPPRSPTSSASNILFAPRSPTSAAFKSQMAPSSPTTAALKSKGVPKTPEPAVAPTNEASREILSERTVSSALQTPASTSRKTSQIRRSLRTIGKLINGSDKRSQRSKMEETLNNAIASVKKIKLKMNIYLWFTI